MVHKFQITEANIRAAFQEHHDYGERNSRCCMFHQALRPLVGHNEFGVFGPSVEDYMERYKELGLLKVPGWESAYEANDQFVTDSDKDIVDLQQVHDDRLEKARENNLTEDQFVTEMLCLVQRREFLYVEVK